MSVPRHYSVSEVVGRVRADIEGNRVTDNRRIDEREIGITYGLSPGKAHVACFMVRTGWNGVPRNYSSKDREN